MKYLHRPPDVCTVLLMYGSVYVIDRLQSKLLTQWERCLFWSRVPLLSAHLWVCVAGLRGSHAES